MIGSFCPLSTRMVEPSLAAGTDGRARWLRPPGLCALHRAAWLRCQYPAPKGSLYSPFASSDSESFSIILAKGPCMSICFLFDSWGSKAIPAWTSQCTSIEGLMAIIRWYLGFDRGLSGGLGGLHLWPESLNGSFGTVGFNVKGA